MKITHFPCACCLSLSQDDQCGSRHPLNPGCFEFEVSDCFMLGCPLGLVLAMRRTVLPAFEGTSHTLSSTHTHKFNFETILLWKNLMYSFYSFPILLVAQLRPACSQIFNLFYPSDPSASRLEPLLHPALTQLPPFPVPRYQRYPLGDRRSSHIGKSLILVSLSVRTSTGSLVQF